MMVSSRLSRCTRTPVGRTPMMATSAKAMTPRQSAISTMVKAAFLPLARGLGVIGSSPAGFDFSGANVMEISLELRTGRLIHAGAAGQPVDANEVVRVIQRRIDHRHVVLRIHILAVLIFREKNAAFGQRNQLVPTRSKLALRIEHDVRDRKYRRQQSFSGWKRQRRTGGHGKGAQIRVRSGREGRIKLVRRNENALRQALPFGKVPRVPPPRLVPDGPRCQ